MEKILIINYDPVSTLKLENLLEQNGYKTYIAEDSRNGLEIAKRYIPDLIICDTILNGINGFDVKSELSALAETSIIPFFFITSQPSLIEMHKAMLACAEGYFSKEFDDTEFLFAINSRLKKTNFMKEKYSSATPTSIEDDEESKKNNDHVLVKIGKKLRLIKFDNIVCVLALKEYSKIICEDNHKYIIRKSMKKWAELLSENSFLRIHRATIININFIERAEKIHFRSYNVFLKNMDEPFVLSQRYAKKLKNIFIS